MVKLINTMIILAKFAAQIPHKWVVSSNSSK